MTDAHAEKLLFGVGGLHRSYYVRPGDLRDDAEQVMQLDRIAGLQTARHRLRTDPREAHLPVRIVRINDVDVQRYLPVNADGLDLLDDRRLGSFQLDGHPLVRTGGSDASSHLTASPTS